MPESLRRIRNEIFGWSQRDLAAECDISYATVVSVENGKKKPNPMTVHKVCNRLGIRPDFITEFMGYIIHLNAPWSGKSYLTKPLTVGWNGKDYTLPPGTIGTATWNRFDEFVFRPDEKLQVGPNTCMSAVPLPNTSYIKKLQLAVEGDNQLYTRGFLSETDAPGTPGYELGKLRRVARASKQLLETFNVSNRAALVEALAAAGYPVESKG